MRRRLLALAVAAALLAIVACSGSQGSGGQPSPRPTTANAAHGPSFPECGGVSDQTITRLTGVPGLVSAGRNPVGCQWLTDRGIHGPWFFFTWYRGSPIGRERKGDELTRTRVDDISIDGHRGFIAVGVDSNLGESLCTVSIQYQDDFFEWSISFSDKPFPDPCAIAKELAGQSIAAAK